MSTEIVAPKKDKNKLYELITSPETINKLRSQMATHVSPDRLARVAWGALMKTPKLLKATSDSVLFCIAECARLGLEPSLGRVYFLPFDNTKKNVTECQIIIGYQGFLDLARRSGIISSINARCVYANEKFEYRIAIDSPVLSHEPCLTGDKGNLIGAYCIARFKDGGSHVEYMPKSEIDAIRKRSKSGNNGPWVTDYDAMALKTVIRRAAKFWPLTTASPELADAIQSSDDNEYLDVDFDPIENVPSKQSATDRLSESLGITPQVPQEQVPQAQEQQAQTAQPVSMFEMFKRSISSAKTITSLNGVAARIESERSTGELIADEIDELKDAIDNKRKELGQ